MDRTSRLKLKAAVLFMGVLPVSACAAQPQMPVRSVNQANDPLSIIWLHAHPGRDGVSVSGLIKRPHVGYAPITGYIRVDALARDGEILATEYFTLNALTLRSGQGRSFSVLLRSVDTPSIHHVEARYVVAR